ncbi:MAG: hypothetical protein AB9907_08625 [Flexilinea sp.]
MSLKILLGLVLLILFVISYNIGLASLAKHTRYGKGGKTGKNQFGAVWKKIKNAGSYEFWLTEADEYQQLSERLKKITEEFKREEKK